MTPGLFAALPRLIQLRGGGQNEIGSEQSCGVVMRSAFSLYDTQFMATTSMADNCFRRHSYFPLFCKAARGEPHALQQSLAPLDSIDKMAHVFSRSARHPTCACCAALL